LARPPQTTRLPRQRPLSRFSGATPTRAAICAGEGAQLGETRQEAEGQGWAHTRYSAQQVFLLPPQGTLPQPVMQVPIQLLQFLLQNCQHPVNALVHHGKGTLAALEFGGVHLQDLPAAGYQGLEFLGLGIQQRPRLGLSGGAEVGQHLSIQAVGLRQLAQGAGKVPHLARVDYGHGDTRKAQG
jgi:hypothetical protein